MDEYRASSTGSWLLGAASLFAPAKPKFGYSNQRGRSASQRSYLQQNAKWPLDRQWELVAMAPKTVRFKFSE